MGAQLTTYSGLDLNFTLTHPLISPILASGVQSKGIAQLTVRMGVTQAVVESGMDGAVVPSVVPGDQGEIELQVWQTSTLQDELLAWANAVKAAKDNGDVDPFFGATVIAQNIHDGSYHKATGVAPQKIPDKTYQAQAQRVTWILVACDITHQ